MPVPTKAEIAKKQKDLEGFLKKLDAEGKIRETIAVSMVRSAIRQVWMFAPNKLAVLLQAMEPDLDPVTRTKWLYRCAICDKLFKLKDVEVDHKLGEHSFLKPEDFMSYWENILNAPTTSLQVLCIEDHRVKTYMEANNITWEAAVAKKKFIAKTKQKAGEQKKELLALGYKPSQVANQEARDVCYEEILKENK